jgi:hypothetical protein
MGLWAQLLSVAGAGWSQLLGSALGSCWAAAGAFWSWLLEPSGPASEPSGPADKLRGLSHRAFSLISCTNLPGIAAGNLLKPSFRLHKPSLQSYGKQLRKTFTISCTKPASGATAQNLQSVAGAFTKASCANLQRGGTNKAFSASGFWKPQAAGWRASCRRRRGWFAGRLLGQLRDQTPGRLLGGCTDLAAAQTRKRPDASAPQSVQDQ